MTATHGLDSISSNSQLLYVALELSEGQWKLASSNARGQQARLVSMPARNLTPLLSEIARAKARFGLGGRLLGRFFAASRERLREVAARLGVHHLANLAGCPAR